LQLQHRRFLSKQSLRDIAELVDLFRIEEERTVVGRLPGAGVKKLANNGLRRRG
jgi:hypothetical protein